MSKRTVVINNFSDGINSDTDPKLLSESSCVDSLNLVFDDLGRAKSTNGFIPSLKDYALYWNSPNPGKTPAIKNGSGFFSFEADYDLSGVQKRTVYIVYKSEWTEGGLDYTSIHVRDILDNSEKVFNPEGSLSNDAFMGHNLNIKFHYSNNRLFIYDSDMKDSSFVLYFSIAPQERFPKSSASYDYKDWMFFRFPLEGYDISERTFVNGFLRCYINTSTGGDNNYEEGDYGLGISLMFADGSESKIMRMPASSLYLDDINNPLGDNIFPITSQEAGKDISFIFALTQHDKNDIVDVDSRFFLYPYIVGQKIYITDVNPTGTERNLEWRFFGDFHYEKGFKYHNSSEYINIANGSVTDYSTGSVNQASDYAKIDYPNMSSFRFFAGYSLQENIEPLFKTLHVFQNRSFIANIKTLSSINSDRLIISPLGKPSIFPESNFIDLDENDGDEYISLNSFGSSMFAFKKHSLVIIDCSSNDPNTYFVRMKHRGLGVDNDFSICNTEMGLFFANQNGVYFHNGESNQNISFNKIEREWKLLDNSKVITGYDDINKKVLFTTDLSDSKITYVFDLKTQSFSKFDYVDKMATTKVSNYFTVDNTLTIATNNSQLIYESKFDNIASSSKLTTKQFDLSLPSVRKKIRRFYVSFKEIPILSNIDFKYRIDNGNWITIQDYNKSFVSDSNNIIMFDLDRSLTMYYVQLEISSIDKIEINDISIVYRMKNPK